MLALTAGATIFAHALPANAESGGVAPEVGDSVEAFPVEPTPVDLVAEGLADPDAAPEWTAPDPVDWPEESVVEVPLEVDEAPDAAGIEGDTDVLDLDGSDETGLDTDDRADPGPPDETPEAAPDTARLRVLEPGAAEALGIDGVLFELAADAEGSVDLEIDYADFADRFGAAWGSRLRLVELPACALSEPTRPECLTVTELESVNDLDRQTVSVTVELDDAAAEPSTASTAACCTTMSVLALAADGEGATGDWSATDLSHAGSWSHTGSSGGFAYTYELRTPPADGPVPTIALSYSSQSVDGHTSSSNNQSGAIGDGWAFHPGYIERTFTSCSDETGGNTPDQTADWCWKGASESITVSLEGANGSLVKDSATGQWTLTSDDGWKFELLGSPATASAASTERWKITATDGTQYFFGSRADTTASRLTAPVFGNHSGEPCYKSGDFKGSSCRQAYRWLLDRVVDVHGNAAEYNWSAETGHYGAAADASNRRAFHRSARLTSVVYGLRDGQSSVAGVGRVAFTYDDRCTANCWNGEQPRPANWPDTPWDLQCDAAPCTGKHSMAFFSSKRLTGIEAFIRSGSSWSKVDSWALVQRFIDHGDKDDTTMWLESIQQTGHVGGTQSVPPVTFEGVPMANRVERHAGTPSMWRMRMTALTTETGSVTGIWYSDEDCAWGSLPDPHNNSRRCYPTLTDRGSNRDPGREWFHKYVVTQVADFDTTGGQVPLRTYYTYATTGGGTSQLWAWDDGEFTPSKLRTYSQWRGYPQVTTKTGDPNDDAPQLTERTRYYRGMHGQPSTATGTGSRTVNLTDAEGSTVTDHEAVAGAEFETATLNGSSIIESEVTRYWTKQTAVRTYSGGSLKAWMTAPSRTDSRKLLQAGTWQRTRTLTTYDARGRASTVSDLGDLSRTGDESCTRTYYTDNATVHLYESVRREEVVAVACDQTAVLPRDLVSDTRNYYDGNTSLTAAPTKGLLTATRDVTAHDGATATTVQTSATTYDALGRPRAETDALGQVTTTAYTPADRGPTASTVTTNALGHTATVTLAPAWGQPVQTADANGRVTEIAYDPLGRTSAVWAPGWARSANPNAPTASYEYRLSRTAPSAVTTYGLSPSGAKRLEVVELYDSLLRVIQRQEPTPAGGRLISGIEHDSRGLTAWASGPNWVEGSGPSTTLVSVPQGADHARTFYTHDGAGRQVLEQFMSHQEILWSTETLYGGSPDGWMVRTRPPQGGTATAIVADAHDRMIEKRDYRSPTATGDYDAMTYSYDHKGQIAEVTDPEGNTWTFEYDLRGRRTAINDPDTGRSTTAYDDADQVVSTTDARGRTVSTEYDALGRVTATWDGPAGTGARLARWTYDGVTGGLGLPTLAGSYIDGQVHISQVNAYDAAGRPTTTTEWVPQITGMEGLAGSYRVSQYYLPDGSLSHMNLPAVGGLPSESVTYHYNDLGMATRVFGSLSGTPGAVDYAESAVYTAWGELAQRVTGSVQGKRVYETYTYEDGTRRALNYRLSRDAVGATNIAHLSYRYDAAGNVTSIADAVTDAPGEPERQCFVYDHLRRITEAWAQAGTSACADSTTLDTDRLGGPAPYWNSYRYDASGNRTSVTGHRLDGSALTSTYSYDSAKANQLTAVATGTRTDTYGWDASGNLTSRTVAGIQETLEWDANGNLAAIDGPGGTTRMIYNADAERIARIDADGKASLFTAGHEITVDQVGAVRATRSYSHNEEMIATRTTDEGLAWIGRTHQGTALWAVSAATMVVSYRRQDPFGNARGEQIRAWTATQQGFHGGVEDPTGFVAMGARFYDPGTGRFISRDPVVDFRMSQQANGYVYAGNNPMTWTDVSGLNWFTDKLKKAGKWVKKTAKKTWNGIKSVGRSVKSAFQRTVKKVTTWAKNVVKKVTSSIVNFSRKVALGAANYIRSKKPKVNAFGTLWAAASNKRWTVPKKVPFVGGRTFGLLPSTTTQSKMLGEGYAGLAVLTGGSCSNVQGMKACSSGWLPLNARGGTTVGDTFVTTQDKLDRARNNGTLNDLMDHEKHHRDEQWRRYGIAFGAMYLFEEAESQLRIWGNNKSKCTYNRWELDAEHVGHTGYTPC
jgi:RHS repeat-associated protein